MTRGYRVSMRGDAHVVRTSTDAGLEHEVSPNEWKSAEALAEEERILPMKLMFFSEEGEVLNTTLA